MHNTRLCDVFYVSNAVIIRDARQIPRLRRSAAWRSFMPLILPAMAMPQFAGMYTRRGGTVAAYLAASAVIWLGE
jgi:hypothetical protein